MSSSRSIAAARNRRSGDISGSKKTAQPGRPIQSIGGQSMINNQPLHPNMNKQVESKPPNGLPFSKLSVSDAIGLITLRLGKVEQFMIDSMENGTPSENGVSVSNNKAQIDKGVLLNIINRLDAIEKKQMEKVNDTRINDLDNQVNNTNDKISQLKESLNQFIQTTNEKFTDIENAFVELEKNIEEKESSENTEQSVEEEEKIISENDQGADNNSEEKAEEADESDETEEEPSQNIHFTVEEK